MSNRIRGVRQTIPAGTMLANVKSRPGPPTAVPMSTLAQGSSKVVSGGGGGTTTLPSLTNGDIWVGNSSNVATAVAPSGDVTMTNAGVFTIKTSVALAGSPTTTTQASSDSSTKIATTAYVQSAISTPPPGNAPLYTGTGVPALSVPVGSLYTRTDFPEIWMAVGITGTPTIAQTTSNSGDPLTTVTLSSLPTPGNVIVAWVFSNSSNTVQTANGWTQILNVGTGSGGFIAVAYRYVIPGDTVILPAIVGSIGGNFTAIEVAEIGNVSDIWASAFEQSDNQHDQATTTLATNTLTTTNNNDLVLIGVGNYDANGVNITGAAGWTFKEQNNNFGNYGAWALVEKAFATSGSSVSTSFTIPTGSHPSGYATIILTGPSSATTNWILMTAL